MLKRAFYFTLIVVGITSLVTEVGGQTRSRIIGSIKDAETSEPLIGANIIIEETELGAASDVNGNFVIINVPIGTYRVLASMMGYERQVMAGVMVSADRVTRLDFNLRKTVLMGQEVVVTAPRDELHKEVANTQMVVDAMQITDATGVREINSFLARLPGVSEENGYLTIRGGSADQTGMMVNGMSYFNAATGNAETSIPLSAIEQVSLLSGGYNAEYGNFRSGLINVTTKSGSPKSYHGTFTFSRDNSHLRRFGESFYSVESPILRSFLDAEVAFIGTEAAWKNDDYLRQQHPRFNGWISAANVYNIGKADSLKATPMDLYLFGCWMFMATPDYQGLENLSDSMKQVIGYTGISDEIKQAFAQHRNRENYSDWNFDGGFGGPLPLFSKALGNATFYLSHNARERHYIMPVVRNSDNSHTTLLSIKAQPFKNLTLTYNGLHKYQVGVSPIRPAWGDFPDASREGGFMPINNIKYVAKNPEYWFDPPIFPILEQRTFMNGLTINHVLSKSTYWELGLSAVSIRDHSPTGNTRDTSFVVRFGPFKMDESPYGKFLDGNHKVAGYKFPNYDQPPGITTFRFRRKEGDLYDNVRVHQYRAKFDLSSQLGLHHFLKTGFEYNYFDIDHKLWMMWNENAYNVYEFNYHRKPSQTGVYVQDQLNYESIIANIGLRFDYYYGGGDKWPSGDPFAIAAFTPQSYPTDSALFAYLRSGRSYIWDAWVRYDSLNPGFLKPVKNYWALSPRIGISFPVTINSKFYFNYGHFRSNPPYFTMYEYRYRYTKNGLYDMSNPNLEPPRTISYELGVATSLLRSTVLKISWYAKDVSGQHGKVTYQNSTGTINYSAWANNEYEDIQGIELNLSKSDNSWLTGWINFNYMLKKEGLTGRELITDVTINNDQEGLYAAHETRTLPQPKVNATLTLRSFDRWGPKLFGLHPLANWTFTLFGEWQAGKYFTWNPLRELHVSSNMRWPAYYMVDLKIDKQIRLGKVTASFYCDISNLFNWKVSLMQYGYCFEREEGSNTFTNWQDFFKYMASLRLPMYKSAKYDNLRQQYPGMFIAGHDQVGDLRSDSKPYINDPNLPFWLYGNPRDIWVGVRFSF